MTKRGRKPTVASRRSESAKVRAVPTHRDQVSHQELAKVVALYLLWLAEHHPNLGDYDVDDGRRGSGREAA